MLLVLLLHSLVAVEKLQYEVIASYPHDPEAWTQGLYYEDGVLYESTGIYEKSTLRRVDLKTGRVLQKHSLSDHYFAEGITLFEGKLYQLTWLSKKGFIYDPKSFEQIRTFQYPGEGWGLTHDSLHLIMSDGSAKIYFMDPETMETERSITVRFRSRVVPELNELEYVGGYIYANVWYQNIILKIDPANGDTVGYLDLSSLYTMRPRAEGAVLNGIAYNEDEDVFFITGKLWSKLFEIKLSEPSNQSAPVECSEEG